MSGNAVRDCAVDYLFCELVENFLEWYWWGSHNVIGYSLALGDLLSVLESCQPVPTIWFQYDNFGHFICGHFESGESDSQYGLTEGQGS